MNTYTLTGQKGKLVSEVEAVIQTTKKGEEMVEKREYLPTPMIEGNPAYIGVGAGGAKPYGEAKVYISLNYPCNPLEIDEGFEKIKNWIDKRVGQEMQEIGF